MPSVRPILDLTGQRFGRLVAVERLEARYAYWLCKCDCGQTKRVRLSHLRSGATTSCGCYGLERSTQSATKHGMNRTRTHNIWSLMLQRCRDPGCTIWPYYGGRGISVCERWLKFENFLADMGVCPDGLTLERENTDGNYEPKNCRWATKVEQARNKRNNHVLTYQGESLCIAAWAERLGVSRNLLYSRINKGWSVERAFTEPSNRRGAQ